MVSLIQVKREKFPFKSGSALGFDLASQGKLLFCFSSILLTQQRFD